MLEIKIHSTDVMEAIEAYVKWIEFDESCEISFHLVNERGW